MKQETQYLIESNLLEKIGYEYCLVESKRSIPIAAVNLFEGNEDETKIVLYSLVSAFFSKNNFLVKGSIQFFLKRKDEYHWNIYLSDRYDSKIDWKLIVSTVENLFPFMASSNISYLSSGVFID